MTAKSEAWEVVELESQSTAGISEHSGWIPAHLPPDSPVPWLESPENSEVPEDFRTSTCSDSGSLLVQRVPPSFNTPATHLPTFEERFLHLPDPFRADETGEHSLDILLLEAVKREDDTETESILSLEHNPISPNPNYIDETGRAAIHYAVLSGSLRICMLLMDFGQKTDVNLQDSKQCSALHYAVKQLNVPILQFLLRCGADPCLQDQYGNTPLHLAALSDSEEVINCFLRRNVPLNCRNTEGKTALDIAGPVTLHLLKHAKSRSRATSSYSSPTNPFSRILIHDSSQEDVDSLMGRLSSRTRPSVGRKWGPEDFDLLQQLGKGSFGEVYLVRNRSNDQFYAMKVLRKDKIMAQNLVRYAMTERNVLSYIRHPFIVSLNAAFQTADRLFLMLDYCPGGDMGWHLNKEKRFNEYRAKIYASEVLLALEELHKRDIIFRDLKPDNVVFDQEGHAMLTDFGLSKEGVYGNESAKSFCGSVAYLAPEMLRRQGHGKAVDWYLLGVLIYEMLVGTPPFYSKDRDQLFHNIQHGTLRLPKALSIEAKTIIRAVIITQLLERNPQRRLGSGPKGAEEIKQFPFFKGINWEAAARRDLRPPVLAKPVAPITVAPEDVYGVSQRADQDSYIAGWSFVIS